VFEVTVGPCCPRCGCNDTALAAVGSPPQGRAWARFACGHCAAEFCVGSPPAGGESVQGVIYRPLRCPKCGSDRTPVTSSPAKSWGRKKRWHKCDDCEHTFKSIEG
jgi:DNA-directed RNA polymerase subunit RPC12/RpoP